MSKKISELPLYNGMTQPDGEVPISINGVTYKIKPDKLIALVAGLTNTSQLINDGADGVHPYLVVSTLPDATTTSKGVIKLAGDLGGTADAPTVKTTEQRVTVADANYTISNTANQMIAFTSLSTARTLTLPAATTANQRVRVVDESFTCNDTRRIIVAPNGTDTVSGSANAILNFPGASAYFESNGAGKWTTLSTTEIPLSAGIVTLPTITDNANGTVTIGNNGIYSLYANADGSGSPKNYTIAGGTYAMTDGALNYIIAKYDTPTAVTSVFTSVADSDVNNFSSIRVFTIYRQGSVLFIRDNDSLGKALANKLQRNAEQTNNIRVSNGTLLLSESATRIVNVSAGTAYIGGIEIPLAAVASSTANTMFFVTQTSPGVWDTTTFAPGGQYSNTQFNPASGGLSTLSNGKYGVIFVFRSLGQGNKLAYVLGQGDYTLGEAQLAKRPSNLPSIVSTQMLPVGRIIVLKGASTATQIDKITDESYAFAGVTDHEALQNLLGGATGEHYHLTLAQYDKATAPAGTILKTRKDITGTTYTLLASDVDKILYFTNASGCTVTVPSGLTTSQEYESIQYTAGQVSFVTSGTTLRMQDYAVATTYGQYSRVLLSWIDTETYSLFGDLAMI